jgi:hypothetical protein
LSEAKLKAQLGLARMIALLKNKKGQFYIFIAILLITYVLTISPPRAAPKKPVPVFKQLHQNYVFEAPKAINAAIYDNANLSERFMNFSDAFVDYSKGREARFGLLYLLAYEDGLDVKNYLSETANVTTNTASFLLTTNSWRTINRTNSVSIYLGNLNYDFSFTEPIQLRALFKTVAEKEVKVHVYD